ncbi:uncharacterized protein LOC121877139 [Homarus americanus]|uniref:Putative 7tm Chemosensory receptor-containing protein 5 n=1 Tax=Homarus americanus TaxID=6706 RepID=A0A8J5JL62_HOMAM|nr:uncharacterized protein LOC121877139 [Homarus americanus]KAG7159705.1 putative 7tm Chemosensory receptor-containing protein 5 [Homarus americanus]
MTTLIQDLRQGSLRSLAVVLQVVGMFPYTWPNTQTPSPHQFSLVLFLWDMFIQLYINIITPLQIVKLFLTMFRNDIGGIVLKYSVSLAFMITSLVSALLCSKSSKLASALTDLHARVKTNTLGNQCHMRLVYIIIVMLVEATMVLFSVPFYINYPHLSLAEKICFFFNTLFSVPSLYMSHLFFRMTFSILAQQLVEAVEDVVSLAQHLPSHNLQPTKGQHDIATTMMDFTTTSSPLHDLESRILQVEETREKLTDYFFLGMTTILVTGLILCVATIYTLSRGYFEGGFTFTLLLGATIMLINMCSVGQNFINEVDKAAGMLKKFSCQSSNYFVKAQVRYLLHLLEPLQIFDFYGWYRLDYSTVVGVVNLLVTYLVILVQVGDQPLNRQA